MNDIQKFISDYCWDRLNKLELSGEYVDRLQEELNTLFKLNMEEYLLIVFDYCKFCRDKNIATGYGRGSSVGSLVVWLLEVTKVDPIKHGLSFTRFIGGHKPDIDLDVDGGRREELISYLYRKYKGHIWRVYTIDKNGRKRLNPVSYCIDRHNVYEPEEVSGEMAILQSESIPKYDILTSSIVGKYQKIIDEHNVKINFNDADVWKSIWQSTEGLFQLDADYSSACIKQVKPESIEELSDGLAIIRSEHKNEYLKRRNGQKMILKTPLWKYTAKTYGIVVYQEQFIDIMKQYVTGESAYRLMKDKNHKYLKDVQKIAKDNNIKELVDIYMDTAKYSFNKSHGIAYAYIIYIGAYLRYYYKDEFFKQEEKKEEAVVDRRWKEVKNTSNFNSRFVNDELVFGFDVLVDADTYQKIKSITKKDILIKLKSLPEKVAVKLLAMGVYEDVLCLNNIDCVNCYYDFCGINKRLEYFDKDGEYLKQYERSYKTI